MYSLVLDAGETGNSLVFLSLVLGHWIMVLEALGIDARKNDFMIWTRIA